MGFSVPFQQARVEQLAKERQFEIRDVITDVHSAKQVGRPGFARLLEYLETHPEVRDILVHRVDRLIRNHYEYGLIVEQLGVRVHSVIEPTEDNAAGRLMHGMNVVVAKYHSDNLAQEVRKGQSAKFAAGGCVGRAPVGYLNIPRTCTQKAHVVVDSVTAPLVRLMFERFAKGTRSLKSVANELFALGLKTRTGLPFPSERIWSLLQHPFYVGRVRYGTETRPGLHEAIISEELWNEVQAVVRARSRLHGEKGKKFFLLRGLLTCVTCGCKLTAEDHPKGSYYRCVPDRAGKQCLERYIPVRELDQAVVALLPDVVLKAEDRDRIRERLGQVDEERRRARAREERDLADRRRKLSARMSRLTDRLADGTVTREHYEEKREEYRRELEGLTDRLKTLTSSLVEDSRLLDGILQKATAVVDLFRMAVNPNDRKDLLREVFRTIHVRDRGVVEVEYNPPFDLIQDGVRAGDDAVAVAARLLRYASDAEMREDLTVLPR